MSSLLLSQLSFAMPSLLLSQLSLAMPSQLLSTLTEPCLWKQTEGRKPEGSMSH